MVMIKYVINALSNYIMSCYRLPKHLIREFYKIIFRFWHLGDIQSRKLTWDAWGVLLNGKSNRGLGIIDFFLYEPGVSGKNWVDTST